MKKVLLTTLVSFFALLAFGQERVNASLPVISDEISAFHSAKGWWYNFDTGQWKDRDNDIPAVDRFKKIEFRTMNYKNEDFIIVLISYDDGYWDYPSIHEGFHACVTVNYYVIKKDEFVEKIKKLNDSHSLISFHTVANDFYINRTIQPFNEAISSEINKNQNNDKEYTTLNLQQRNFKEKNIIQFLVYKHKCRIYDYNKPGKKYKKELVSERCTDAFNSKKREVYPTIDKWASHLGNEEIFDFFYFEADLDEFIKKFTLNNSIEL